MSSSASELTTVTEERTEIAVETETVTRYQCPVCEQVVDEEELISVTVGETDTVICEYCARSVFGVDVEPDTVDVAETIGNAADGVRETLVKPVLRLGLTIAPVVTLFWVLAQVIQDVLVSVDPAQFEQASQPVVATDVFSLLPVVVLGVLAFTFAWMLSFGPRV